MKAENEIRCAYPHGGFSQMTLGKQHKGIGKLIQLELDRISAIQPSMEKTPLALRLAFQRLHFLSWQERVLLLENIHDMEDFLALGLAEIESFLYRSMHARPLDMGKIWEQAERDINILDRLGARFVCVVDKDYPPLLREIHRAPFGLFVRGDTKALNQASVTMVGTRSPTSRGLYTAQLLAKETADEGIVIVSGIARGIDAASHRGAIQSGAAATIAVLPCGPERVYPSSNAALAAKILDCGGCLVTEYPPGVSLDRYRFPERNRILAGFSKLTLVVEAPEKSGALITAEIALSEGRDVAVAASCLGSSRNSGADALKEDGALAIKAGAELVPMIRCEYNGI
ncbi:MAG TPA: DNA-processing protein DprA [Rectinema sp.]|jgi:DNA processing protein|nr:DNA-processing protein DprA [Spirochaetia bacterium]OQC75176.1 MAG: hypothetical protein BWX44_00197 [Spirochaetes bacterium ADurb.Bin001]HOE98750.1 DNA-processing protein DprA [Rectinema sp.]HPD68758.1 DNA-processing protein DprA [Rectinema sp.]HPG90324.1 DNA-processing protein DprA [Rectinema sp.]